MVRDVKRTFASGELAPAFAARSDLAEYHSGAKTLTNFLVRASGGAYSRPGTGYLGASTATSIFVPFVFSIVQAYLLEFVEVDTDKLWSAMHMRVWKDDQLVGYPFGSTNNRNIRTTGYTWTASAAGNNIYYLVPTGWGGYPTSGPPEPVGVFENGVAMTRNSVAYLAAGEWGFGNYQSESLFDVIYVRLTDEVDPDTKADGYLTESTAVNVNTTYTLSQLSAATWTQSADKLYIAGPDLPVLEITRTSDTDWTSTPLDSTTKNSNSFLNTTPTATYSTTASTNTRAVSYALAAVDSNGREYLTNTATISTLVDKPIAVGEYVTITFDQASGKITDKWRIYKAYNDSRAFGLIGEVEGVDTTEGLIQLTFQDNDYEPDQTQRPLTQAYFNGFAQDSDNPALIDIYQQRMILARSDNAPTTITASRPNEFEDYTYRTVLQADDAVQATLAGQQINAFRHMVVMRSILLFTDANVWAFGGDRLGGPLSALSFGFSLQDNHGADASLKPLIIGNSCLYLERGAKTVRELRFSWENQVYASRVISVLGEHLLEDRRPISWAYQSGPNIAWAACDDGKVLALQFEPEANVLAWTLCEAEGHVVGIASLPQIGGDDALYWQVKYANSGTDEYTLERVQVRLEDKANPLGSWCLDSAKRYRSRGNVAGITTSTTQVVVRIELGTSPGYQVGDIVLLDGMTGAEDGNKLYGQVTNTGAFTVTVKNRDGSDLDSSGWSAWESGGYLYKCAKTFRLLEHLEGETVYVQADGNVLTATVANASITLEQEYGNVIVGRRFTARLEPLGFEAQGQDGSTLGREANLSSITLKLYRTGAGWKIGPDEDNLVEPPVRTDEDWNEATELYTGSITSRTLANWATNDGAFVLIQDQPVPIEVLAVIPDVEYGGV